ncbi:MAG: hypothetical protein NZ853_01710 [Leptospiraceae bacterium]|nr:hypothetical protein [Leptospiraceae bacterium]MDW7976057.1 hypothetical protein [Leptospiraceae bacterium]
MKFFYFLSFVIIEMVLAMGNLRAQNVANQNIASQGHESKDIIKIENYFPVSIEDPRIEVREISLDRRFSPDGKGEFLDIMFNIENMTNQKIDLYVWVIAYYETDAVDKEERLIVPHPTWRVYDPDKRFFLTRYIKITPRDIPTDKIWSPADPDHKTYFDVIKRMRNAVGHMKLIEDIYPPVWKYVSYIMRYPTQGLPVILYGDLGPTPDKLMFTNYIPPTPEEKRTKIFKNFVEHTYTVEYARRRTIFRSHHYSPYRPNFYFFNMFRILIFDANQAQVFEEQAQRPLREGESPANPVMYHRIFSISKEIKIR